MRIRETNDGCVPLAEGLWTVEHHRRAAGIHTRLRMNVVRLAGGGLWLHSPVPIDDRLAAQLSGLGPVEHIVAPNRFHHLGHRGGRVWRLGARDELAVASREQLLKRAAVPPSGGPSSRPSSRRCSRPSSCAGRAIRRGRSPRGC